MLATSLLQCSIVIHDEILHTFVKFLCSTCRYTNNEYDFDKKINELSIKILAIYLQQ